MAWISAAIAAILLCAIRAQAVRIGKMRRAAIEADYMLRMVEAEAHRMEGRAIAMRKERDLWRGKWKQGAFEMDASSMAALADEDCRPCDVGNT